MTTLDDQHDQPGTYAQIRERSKEQLIREYDIRRHVMPFHDANFWLSEIYRRSQDDATEAMLRSTLNMERLTKLITVLTIINFVVAAIAVWATVK